MAIILQPQSSSGPRNTVAPKYNMTYVWGISMVAAMGGLLFGYDWVVIGGAKLFYEKYFQITEGVMGKMAAARMSGWANSCALLGCLIGSIISGTMSDKFGRKKLLIVSGFLFAITSIMTGAATTFNAFIFWRITGGVAIGMASNLSPMYIAEVSPAAIRGRLVAANQLTIVIGILAAQLVNMMIANSHPLPANATDEIIRMSWCGQMGWRWMFYAVTVPSAAFFLLALFVPESPRWLVKNGRAELAQKILAKIGGEAHAAQEVAMIQETLVGETRKVKFSDLLEPRMMKILTIGIGLTVLQQWSGINSIFNYAEEIFKMAGYGVSGIMFNIVITGAVNFVFTIATMAMVDKFGRRGLMLFGCLALAITHTWVGMSFHLKQQGIWVVVPVMATLTAYALSLAPVTWVLISEIFPNRIRGAAISIAVSALWIACFILTYAFPTLNAWLGAAKTFWLYAGICAVGFIFILLKVPETKGKTLEQIEKELVD